MIPRDKELEVAVWLRSEVGQTLGGIKDASVFMRFDDPSTKWLTSNRLEKILSPYEVKLRNLGAVPVTLHGDCGAKDHSDKAKATYQSTGFWRHVLPSGETDAELARDGIIYLDNKPMTTEFGVAVDNQTPAKQPCPCGKLDRKHPHQVSRYFIWPDEPDSRLAELCAFTNSLRDAIEASDDRRRRSGIREQMLLILMGLDRLILDRSVEDVLAERGMASS